MGLFDSTNDEVKELLKRINSFEDYEALSDSDKQLLREAVPKLVEGLPLPKQIKLAQMRKAADAIEEAIESVLEYVASPGTTAHDCERYMANTVLETTKKIYTLLND